MASPHDPRNPDSGNDPSSGDLNVLDGYTPRTHPPAGHAVLYLPTPEQRIRRVVGWIVETFHDVLWNNHSDRRRVRLTGTVRAKPYEPDPGDEPA